VEFLHERIFEPLAMASAGDCLPVRPSDPVPYTRYATGPPRPVAREGANWYWGSAELCMTPSDLARWDMALLEHRVLSARSYDELTREARLPNGDSTHYALGLQTGELNGAPMLQHSGEVSGFLAANYVFPGRRAAVAVLSNEDGVRMVSALARDLGAAILGGASGKPAVSEGADPPRLREILENLERGRIDRAWFTSDANAYFSEQALADFKNSLAGVGKLKALTRVSQESRGGMTHFSYRAVFLKKALALNLYLTPEGKYEQFMVEDQIQ
jgi:CubicO group peptidase (beta-lactamase class C family)